MEGKYTYSYPKWLKIARRVLMIMIPIIFGVIVYLGFRKRERDLDFLYKRSFNGKIVKYKNLLKMDVKVWLEADTFYAISGFALFLKDITLTDSLVKHKESDSIYYYKKDSLGNYYLHTIHRFSRR
jgi:hypothetical protein